MLMGLNGTLLISAWENHGKTFVEHVLTTARSILTDEQVGTNYHYLIITRPCTPRQTASLLEKEGLLYVFVAFWSYQDDDYPIPGDYHLREAEVPS